MKHLILLTLLLIALMFLPEILNAQLPGFPDEPPQVPIDGGLGILAAAGGAYALNILRKRKT